MSAKLILSMDGAVLKEYEISKERTLIGRKPHNDIVIENLAVSSEHAAVITILNDSFLEDLDSTNGLSVNGVVTKKHFLQNNDVIEIGKYKLKYLNDQPGEATPEDFEKTMVLNRPAKAAHGDATGRFTPPVAGHGDATGRFATSSVAKPAAAIPAQAPAASQPSAQQAAVQILNGPNAGRELELVKSLTTLGKPGVQVAVLARRPHGFFITHVEGESFPSVNGASVGEQPHQLADHDIIELAGVKMEFYFKA